MVPPCVLRPLTDKLLTALGYITSVGTYSEGKVRIEILKYFPGGPVVKNLPVNAGDTS